MAGLCIGTVHAAAHSWFVRTTFRLFLLVTLRYLCGSVFLGAHLNLGEVVDMTPVDFVARAIVALSSTRESGHAEVYHLTNIHSSASYSQVRSSALLLHLPFPHRVDLQAFHLLCGCRWRGALGDCDLRSLTTFFCGCTGYRGCSALNGFRSVNGFVRQATRVFRWTIRSSAAS